MRGLLVLRVSWHTLGTEYPPEDVVLDCFSRVDGLSKSELVDIHFLNWRILPSRALCLCSSVLEICLQRESRDMLLL